MYNVECSGDQAEIETNHNLLHIHSHMFDLKYGNMVLAIWKNPLTYVKSSSMLASLRTIIKSFLYIYMHQYLYTCIVIVCEHGLRILYIIAK